MWQLVHGTLAPPILRSSREPYPAATGLWHWLHNTLMFGIFSSRAFCEPCGVWQARHPSALTGGVLVNERTAHIRVALGADHILIGRGPQVVVPERAVNVMTVVALDHAFVHRMVEGHTECRLHVGVALKAERGL